jgi:protocatechuate 3,4-dioxygenase alpha subunit
LTDVKSGAGPAAAVPLQRTPSQTIGPYFGFALPWADGPLIVPAGTPGSIRLVGQVTDGLGNPVPDCLIETWQADPTGRFNHPEDHGSNSDFRGFGRCPTDDDGRFAFVTLKPGRVTSPDGTAQAPHVEVSIFARGLLKRLVTRIYFEDEAVANRTDPILALVTDAAARATLIAAKTDDGYRFDIRLQGDGETVFFDF